MGVITLAILPVGKVLGPIPTNLTLTDPAYLIGHMTCDNKPDVHTVKLDINEFGEASRAGEWVPYVQPARDEREQNLEAFVQTGQLHYRATRTINANEELLVWYSKEFALMLGVPELQSFHIKEGGIFCCPYCMETFRYPNSLRAHMRFKCEHRRQMEPPGGVRPPVSSAHAEHKPIFNPLSYNYMTGSIDRAAAGRNFYAAYPHLLNSHRFPVPASIPVIETLNSKTLPSPTSSTSSGQSLSNGRQSPDRQELRNRLSPEKRLLEDREEEDSTAPSPKRQTMEDSHGTPPDRRRQSLSPSERAHSPTGKVEHNGLRKLDQNQNLHNSSDEEDTISAFRKVEKHSRRPSLSPPTSHASVPSQAFSMSTQSSTIFSPTPITAKRDFMAKEFAGGMSGSLLPRYPILPGGLPPPLLPGGSTYNENVPMHIADIYRNTLKMGELMRPEKLVDIHNIENNNLANVVKVPYMPADARMPPLTPAMAATFYKSTNPMVEKLLTTPLGATPPCTLTSLSMAQNWCAKCNATFRMTSDLVYHMRSHHKQYQDPQKKKREDKLKCTICGETFKERHHLTRHMTSHQ